MFRLHGNLDYALERMKAARSQPLIQQAPQLNIQQPSGIITPSGIPYGVPYAKSNVIYSSRKGGALPYGVERFAQNNIFTQPQFYSPLHTPQNWQIPSKRRETYQWCRYFYENEPKVGAAIDFYSHFPMAGFETQCEDGRLKRIFDNLNKKLNLDFWSPMILKEKILLGDVFPFMDIECGKCGGSGVDRRGYPCDHAGGTFRRMVVLNPDWIDVQTNVLAEDPVITLLPDDELRKIVWYKTPLAIYNRIPSHIRSLILAGKPIPLDNQCVSHLKYNPYPYGVYGVSMVRRLFKTLTYKDKLMTAQWIVAERLILPIRIVKVGDAERPAGDNDIAAVQAQLAQVMNDPNLTLVTHHALDYDWVGCFTTDDNNSHVLTKEGLKHFSKIREDDLIATWNKDTGKVEFQKYIRKVIFPYTSHNSNGYAYRIGNEYFSFVVTPNHRHYMADGIVKRSDELAIGDSLLMQSSWQHEGVVPENLPYKSRVEFKDFALEEFCKFAGYYISEGHVKREGNKNLSNDKKIQCFGMTQRMDSPIYNDMRFLMSKISDRMWVSEDDRENIPCHQFMIGNADLSRWLATEFGDGSHYKKIPSWMLELPVRYLSIIFDAMMAGDGTSKSRTQYNTTSLALRNNVCELMVKTGKSPRVWEENRKSPTGKDCKIYRISCTKKHEKARFKITHVEAVPYEGPMWCLELPNGNFFVQVGKQILLTGNTNGKVLQLSNEYELIDKEILQGLMINEALLSGQMAGYQSAAIGAETLIQRLEQWRNEFSRWIEEKIYKSFARMKALAGDKSFIDEEATREFGEDNGEPIYRYPKVKWNDLNIRDDTQQKQTWMQLHERQVLSTQTLCEKMDIDYDQEVERLRFESATQQMNQGGPGGAGGMGGMGGGAGGAMPMGGAPGGDMGMPGGAPGGMPGTDMGMGGAPGADIGMGGMGGGMGAGAPAVSAGGNQFGGSMGKILSKDKAKKISPPEEQAVQPTPIKLTSLEQTMAKTLYSMQIPFKMWIQFPLGRYKADFAVPALKLAIECDGEYWHKQPQALAHDQKRDAELSRYGWTVARFGEREIKENLEGVKKTISVMVHKCWMRALDEQNKKTQDIQQRRSEIHAILEKQGTLEDAEPERPDGPVELDPSTFEGINGEANQGQGN